MTAHGSPSDFDFEFGDWRVAHRRLNGRLVNSTDWQEFGGTCSTRPILGGAGNLEDNVIDIPTGSYRAIALRAFNPETRTWAIWWLDSRSPHTLDTPVIGGFKDGVGIFYSDDILDGRPIRVRFIWSKTREASPQWEQAFSTDGGESWETNWVMRFTRV